MEALEAHLNTYQTTTEATPSRPAQLVLANYCSVDNALCHPASRTDLLSVLTLAYLWNFAHATSK